MTGAQGDHPDRDDEHRHDPADVRNQTGNVSGANVQAGLIGELHVHGDHEPADPLGLAAQRLADSVGRQWTEEAGFRSLLRPEPLRLRWSTTARRVALDQRAGELRWHGDRHQLVEMFRSLPHRRLVILGAPGAGKSVLALLLVLALLDEPVAGEPVPVLFTASSWNPREEHLHTWLARRLAEEYPGLGDARTYGPDAAIELVTKGRIIPILDGLDETPQGLHVKALEALDSGEPGKLPLVVTCRATEYAAAVAAGGTGLSRAAVVELEPVDLADVTGFLTSSGPSAPDRWRPVLDRLRTDPDAPLTEALTSPLMVALARTVYTDPKRDPAELLDPARFGTQLAIERHLLDSFVTAAYREQPEVPGRTWSSTRSRYPADRAQDWLRFLARHLDRLGTRDLAWWELLHAVPPRTRALLTMLTSGLLAVATGFVANGIDIGVVGVVAGFFVWFGLPPGVVFLRGYAPRPTHIELTFHSTLSRFLGRFLLGFAIGFLVGLAYGLHVDMALLAGCAPGFALASYSWWSIPTDVSQVSTPATLLRRERTASAAYGLILGLAFGNVAGMIFGLTAHLTLSPVRAALVGVAVAAAMGVWGHVQYGPFGGVLYGLLGGVAGGLTSASPYTGPIKNLALLGLAYGVAFTLTIAYGGMLSRAWGVFLLHRTWLALCGKLPFRLLDFLDDAHRRGILRQAGGVYQFRHALLQDRLALSGPGPGIPRQRVG